MSVEQNKTVHWYTTGILGLFAVGFLLLVLFGAKIYLGTVSCQNENDNRRAVLSYLATAVHACDGKGAVLVGQGPQGDMLLLRDSAKEEAYEHRIYCYQGSLLEEYVNAEAAFDPEHAQVIGKTDRFSLTRQSQSLLRISTDEGEVLLCLRSEEDG